MDQRYGNSRASTERSKCVNLYSNHICQLSYSRRPRSPSPGASDKENDDSKHRPKRRGRNALYEVLEDCKKSDSKLLEEAQARDDLRQEAILDRLDRMTDGIAALTEVTKEKMERERDQQKDVMQMLLQAALEK